MTKPPAAPPLLRDSTLILMLVGIPAAVFANTISDALKAEPVGWLYIVASAAVISSLILGRVVLFLYAALQAVGGSTASDNQVTIDVKTPEKRSTLGDLIANANSEIAFMGIIAKRSVSDDIFRRSIELRRGRPITIRFLLLDPDCSAFEARARDENEDARAWRSDLEATSARLRGYRDLLGINVELRLTSNYPIWRGIIVDNDIAYINTFLPGKRGTETLQYVMRGSDVELTYGWSKYFAMAWRDAKEVTL